MSSGPSAHLSWDELACKDGTPYPLEWRTIRAVTLAQMFERFRSFLGGQSLTVLSGYRSPSHNAAIGGAAHSQHVQGLAVDIAVPSGLTRQDFHEAALTFFRAGECRGIGLYPWGVHLDMRIGPRASWRATGAKDSG